MSCKEKVAAMLFALIAMQAQAGPVACAPCHGREGEGKGQFPRLAAMSAPYLEKELQDFRAGRRSNPMMSSISKSLTDAAIREYAQYYSSLPEVAVKLGGPGGKLAAEGDWERGLPPCFQCHGPQGEGIAPHFPAISNQPAAYTTRQLANWKNGSRTNDPAGLMQSVAGKLDEDEIRALAAYLEAKK